MPGAQADITVFDFAHPLIGQVIDPIKTLLIGGASRDVRDVFVAGRHVVQNGAIPGFDLAAAHATAQAQFDGLVAKYPERTWKHPPVERIFTSSYPRR
jgi:cytosine/adenosine deaminase-related metal-dependent hydrolase